MTWSGVDRFSMTEVSQAAKISRQTLYRYFPSKEALVEGVIDDQKQQIAVGMMAAVERDSSIEGRLRAICGNNSDPVVWPGFETLLRAHPNFMLRFVGAAMGELRRLMLYAAEPLLTLAERTHGVLIDRALVAETLVRMRLSLFLLPQTDTNETSQRMIRGLLFGLIDDPTSWTVEAGTPRRQRKAAE